LGGGNKSFRVDATLVNDLIEGYQGGVQIEGGSGSDEIEIRQAQIETPSLESRGYS
jgi:hypothetical protein